MVIQIRRGGGIWRSWPMGIYTEEHADHEIPSTGSKTINQSVNQSEIISVAKIT